MLPSLNWNLDSVFPDDFYNFSYPMGFNTHLEARRLRAKRQQQQKVLTLKRALDNAIEAGDIQKAASLAEQLAKSKAQLLELSRSQSTVGIARAADQSLNHTKQLFRTLASTQEKDEQEEEEEEDGDEEQNEAQIYVPPKISQEQKEETNVAEPPKIQMEVDTPHLQKEQSTTTKNKKTDDPKKNDEVVSQIKKICTKAHSAVSNAQNVGNRVKEILSKLDALKKDFYEIDASLMEAVLNLDGIEVSGPETREMRKKAVAYYMETLQKMDEALKPLAEYEMKFKSRV